MDTTREIAVKMSDVFYETFGVRSTLGRAEKCAKAAFEIKFHNNWEEVKEYFNLVKDRPDLGNVESLFQILKFTEIDKYRINSKRKTSRSFDSLPDFYKETKIFYSDAVLQLKDYIQKRFDPSNQKEIVGPPITGLMNSEKCLLARLMILYSDTSPSITKIIFNELIFIETTAQEESASGEVPPIGSVVAILTKKFEKKLGKLEKEMLYHIARKHNIKILKDG